MSWSVGAGNLMCAAATQGTPAAFAAGAPADNTIFPMIHAFFHVLTGQFYKPCVSSAETTGSRRYPAK